MANHLRPIDPPNQEVPPALAPQSSNGGGGSYHRLNRIEARLDALSDNLSKIDGQLGHLCTKADMQESIGNLYKWMLTSTIAALLAIGLALIKSWS